MVYMLTFTINIPQMSPNVVAYIPYMDPMGIGLIKTLQNEMQKDSVG